MCRQATPATKPLDESIEFAGARRETRQHRLQTRAASVIPTIDIRSDLAPVRPVTSASGEPDRPLASVGSCVVGPRPRGLYRALGGTIGAGAPRTEEVQASAGFGWAK